MSLTFHDPKTGQVYHLPKPPPRTAQQRAETKARMQALQERIDREGDAAIDTSDIPELTEADFARALRPGRPPRTPGGTLTVTARLDRDLVEWLKQGGRGYQTRLNAILRQAMERQTVSR